MRLPVHLTIFSFSNLNYFTDPINYNVQDGFNITMTSFHPQLQYALLV